MADDLLDATDIKNGWTAETLAAYRAERNAVHPFIGGNIVAEYRKPKPGKVLISARHFNPHKW